MRLHLTPHQRELLKLEFQRSYFNKFLQTPHSLIDRLPRMSCCTRRVFDLLILKTYGYRVSTCTLSFSDIAYVIEFSTRNVKRSIRKLLKLGIVAILAGGRAGAANEYTIDFNWNQKESYIKGIAKEQERTPEPSLIQPSLIQAQNQTQSEPEIDMISEGYTEPEKEPITERQAEGYTQAETVPTDTDRKPETETASLSSQEADQEAEIRTADQGMPAEQSLPTEPERQAEQSLSDPDADTKALIERYNKRVSDRDTKHQCSANSVANSNIDRALSIPGLKKHTCTAEQIKIVCLLIKSTFKLELIDLNDRTLYAFAGTQIRTYGFEAVMRQLGLLRDEYKFCRPFNWRGLLVASLKADYQPGYRIRVKQESDKYYEDQFQKGRERDAELVKIGLENEANEKRRAGIKARLGDAEIAKLTDKARENLTAKGVNPMFMEFSLNAEINLLLDGMQA